MEFLSLDSENENRVVVLVVEVDDLYRVHVLHVLDNYPAYHGLVGFRGMILFPS